MAWPELVQVSCFLTFSCFLLYLVYKCHLFKKKILGRSEMNYEYVKTKAFVEEYLNEKDPGHQMSRFNNIMKLAKSVIFHRVKNRGIRQCCYSKHVCKYERSLKILLQGFLNDIQEKGANENYFIKSLQFLFKSRAMKHPFDIVGSRRAFVLFEVLHSLLNEDAKITREESEDPFLETDSSIEKNDKNPIYWNSSDLKLLVLSTCIVCLTFFPLYGVDWVSDVLVLLNNYQRSAIVESAFNVTSVDVAGISRKSLLNSIPWDIASVLLVVSTILTIPKLKHLGKLINIQCIMEDPKTEKADIQVNLKTVVKRHDASLIESVTESAVQVIFQWGSYMGLSYLIGKVKNMLADFECSGEKDSSLAAVCLLKETVAFRSNAFLWLSGLGSMVSLTLGQMKSHNVQHEFCTTLKMKAAYAFAALMNTSSYILLCVSIFTSVLDFNNLITDKLEAENYHPKLLDAWRTSAAIIFMVVLGFISVLARFLIFKNKPASEYSISISRKPTCSSIKGFTCIRSFMKNLRNFLKNYLKFLNLPTSQFSYGEEYFCYHSMIILEYINFFMVQCLLYVFFMLYNIIFIGINFILIFSNFTENTYSHQLSPSMVSNSRRNFAIISSVIIPFGWFLSYILLWVYFKLDNGFFSGTNMRFKYEENETGENISGSWVDLNEEQEFILSKFYV